MATCFLIALPNIAPVEAAKILGRHLLLGDARGIIDDVVAKTEAATDFIMRAIEIDPPHRSVFTRDLYSVGVVAAFDDGEAEGGSEPYADRACGSS
jgi:hypothetical protein